MRGLALVAMTAALVAGSALAQVNTGDVKWETGAGRVSEGRADGRAVRRSVQAGRFRDPAEDARGLLQIPAHHHPTNEYVTVISGEFHLGMGDALDKKKSATLQAGGFAEAPAGMNHFAWASAPSVVQVQAEGPFAMTYVNPADDPTKTK